MGQCVELLVEGRKDGKWYGRNRNDKLVFFDVGDDEKRTLKGDLLHVRIDKTGPWSLHGAIVD